jgi:hypothetical protein
MGPMPEADPAKSEFFVGYLKKWWTAKCSAASMARAYPHRRTHEKHTTL